jgi:hypothetical protein
MNRKLLCLALFVFLFPNASARAGTILTNLPGTGLYKAVGQSLATTTWEAVGLTTGTTAETFDSFAGRFTNSTNSGATLEGGIFANNSGNPGTLLSAFTNVVIPARTDALVTLNTASSFTMQPNTNYWFVVHDAPSQFAWVQDNSTNGTVPTASAGNAFVGYRNSINSGAAWTTPGITSANYTVDIAATPTPEPGTLVLFGIGAISLFAISRSRKRA